MNEGKKIQKERIKRWQEEWVDTVNRKMTERRWEKGRMENNRKGN